MKMRPADIVELLGLAAIWGGAFLFMRMGAGEFGPVALAAIRVAGATLVLVPLLAWRHGLGELRRHWRAIAVVGLTNTALPFLCFAYAALSITSGLSAIFNSASPLFGALIARAWFGEGLSPSRRTGLAIGFAGVLLTAWEGASFRSGGSGWAVLACLAAAACYGWSPHFMRRHLQGVAPLSVAAGSQVAATAFLAVPAALLWPTHALPAHAWPTAAALAFVCTGVAYLMYFRLIAHVGAANAIAVTFLIPGFAIVWGWMFLGEGLTPTTLGGCVVILVGTALATGVVAPRAPGRRAQERA
jgi:drug/metabolite transporter (DMT)-like permease